jgi:hypothetical protein
MASRYRKEAREVLGEPLLREILGRTSGET